MLPAVCDISFTNLCNATCDFCAFAHDKGLVKNRRFVDRNALARALPILRRRGIEYFNLQGGEPLLHSQVEGLVGDAVLAGFKVALITNGWQLAHKIEGLIAAGLGTLLVLIEGSALRAPLVSNAGCFSMRGMVPILLTQCCTERDHNCKFGANWSR